MPYTLLLADDSVTIQRVIALTFASEDITVVAFSDGEQAIAAVNRTPPDIVLADVGMPGRNGYEVSRHVKHTPALAHIPVLLLTGAFEPIDEAKVAEAGCDGILIKPFEPQVVIERVKELLRKPKPDSKAHEIESYFEELDRAFASLASALPEPVLDSPADRHHDSITASPSTRIPLAEAFGALLAAEQSHSKADAAGADPSAVPAHNGVPERFVVQQPSLAIELTATDELIERVSRRVLEHLSDAVIREAVTEMVDARVERLVREEIERIKSNIK